MNASALFIHVFLLVYPCAHIAAQCNNIIPPENQALLEQKALFDDAHRSQQFKQAAKRLHWLLVNAPALSSIYIKGAEVFDKLASQESDSVRKQIYIDSLMIVYDLRIKNCGDEVTVINRKALAFLRYHFSGTKADELLPLMKKALEMNGVNTLDGLLEYYMKVVQMTSLKFKDLTQEQILQHYDRVTDILENKIKKSADDIKTIEYYRKIQNENITILTDLIKVDCDFVKTHLGPKYKENPADIQLGKQIIIFMLQGKCSNDPLWLETAESVYWQGPEFALAKNIGLRYLLQDNNDMADKYFKEALALTQNPTSKAEVLTLQGDIQAKKDNKAAARKLYQQALVENPSNKELYEKIGDLYFNSYEECAKRQSQAHDRLVFMIAYDMYQKAGNTKKMENAQSGFPTMSDIFDFNYKVGDKIMVGCWINEETTIKIRK